MQLSIKHRGKPVQLSCAITSETTVGQLRSNIAASLNVDSETTRLLCKGRQIGRDNDDDKISNVISTGATVLVLATSGNVARTIAQGVPDATLFDDVGARSAPQFVGTPQNSSQRGIMSTTSVRTLGGGDYGFGRVEALSEFDDAHRVEAILHRLATDAGVLLAMRERRWRVGALKEMRPSGRVGIDPVCVLGFNRNRGEEIHLRVRTDDCQGFRSISQLMQVLAHELAHNEWDEHDNRFKETMRWVEQKVSHVDWRSSGGRVLSDGTVARAVTTREIANSSDRATQRSQRNGPVGNVAGLSRLVTDARKNQITQQTSALPDASPSTDSQQQRASSSRQLSPKQDAPKSRE